MPGHAGVAYNAAFRFLTDNRETASKERVVAGKVGRFSSLLLQAPTEGVVMAANFTSSIVSSKLAAIAPSRGLVKSSRICDC